MAFFEIVHLILFIIGNTLFPTAGENVDPLTGQGPEDVVMLLAGGSLTLVRLASPRGKANPQTRPLRLLAAVIGTAAHNSFEVRTTGYLFFRSITKQVGTGRNSAVNLAIVSPQSALHRSPPRDPPLTFCLLPYGSFSSKQPVLHIINDDLWLVELFEDALHLA